MDEFIEIKPSNKSAEEQNKGGNFISSPNGTIFYIEGVSQDFLDILYQKTSSLLVEIKCGFKAKNMFRHIDEIMCFMPYGHNKYKVWFYDIFDRSCFRKLFNEDYFDGDSFIEDSFDGDSFHGNSIDKKIQELNEEKLVNLNKISLALFRKSYDQSTDNFVFFKFYSFRPSIFNRTWYETRNTKQMCLFISRKNH